MMFDCWLDQSRDCSFAVQYVDNLFVPKLPGVVKGIFSIAAWNIDISASDGVLGKVEAAFDKKLQAFTHDWNSMRYAPL